MSLFNPVAISGAKKNRVGRGIAAGQGKTAGRGTKGQKSRTGFNIPRRFEGGQNSLISRLPKKKGVQDERIKPVTVSTNKLKNFTMGEIVSPKTLSEKGIIDSSKEKVKIVSGTFNASGLRFRNIKLSKTVKPVTKKHKTLESGAKSDKTASKKIEKSDTI